MEIGTVPSYLNPLLLVLEYTTSCYIAVELFLTNKTQKKDTGLHFICIISTEPLISGAMHSFDALFLNHYETIGIKTQEGLFTNFTYSPF